MPRRLTLLALLGVAACSQIPLADDHRPLSGGDAPTLLPIDSLLAQADAFAAPPSTIAQRQARLLARARLMQGDVLDPATRARLATALRDGDA